MRVSRRFRFLARVTIAGTAALGAALPTATSGNAATNQPVRTLQHLVRLGTTPLTPARPGAPSASTAPAAPASGPETARGAERELPRATATPGRPGGAVVPDPRGLRVSKDPAGSDGFTGLTHRDSRTASNGNQFSLEPPDQGLCAGRGVVLELVNDVLAVYDPSGRALVAPTALNAFYGLPPAIVRTAPRAFGPFVSDPKCLFDPDTGRWFVTALEIDVDRATGDLLGRSATLLAVSQTGDPTGTWAVFGLDTTDDGTGGTPAHPGCPCFGDQPLIGADAFGFHVTTNEFSVFGPDFDGAQVYAMSKQGLAAAAGGATPPPVVHLEPGALEEGVAYSLQPTTVAPGVRFPPDAEYYLSALDFQGTADNRVAVWALRDTPSLASDDPDVQLFRTVIRTEDYATPQPVAQKAGPIPLGASVGEGLARLDSNDDRMGQAVFDGERVWGVLNTGVGWAAAPARTGAAWFAVKPSLGDAGLTAEVDEQGYVAVDGESVVFPSLALNRSGDGAMAFTLVGPDHFPSAAFVEIGGGRPDGPVRVSAPGAAPEDGFSAYGAFGSPDPGVARWGDYSMTVADERGDIWMGNEYIPDAPRTALANWGTFVGHLHR